MPEPFIVAQQLFHDAYLYHRFSTCIDTDVLQILQRERQQQAANEKRLHAPQMIDRADILSRIRQLEITDDEEFIYGALRMLVKEGKVYQQGYSGPYWCIPDKQIVDECLPSLNELAFVCTEEKHHHEQDKTNYHIEGYRLENLRNQLATKNSLPVFVLGEYIVPKLLAILTNTSRFEKIQLGSDWLFINKTWVCLDLMLDWWLYSAHYEAQKAWVKRKMLPRQHKLPLERVIDEDFLKANGYWESMQSSNEYLVSFREAILKKLPHSDDGSYSYHGKFHKIESEKFEIIVNILKIDHRVRT